MEKGTQAYIKRLNSEKEKALNEFNIARADADTTKAIKFGERVNTYNECISLAQQFLNTQLECAACGRNVNHCVC